MANNTLLSYVTLKSCRSVFKKDLLKGPGLSVAFMVTRLVTTLWTLLLHLKKSKVCASDQTCPSSHVMKQSTHSFPYSHSSINTLL